MKNFFKLMMLGVLCFSSITALGLAIDSDESLSDESEDEIVANPFEELIGNLDAFEVTVAEHRRLAEEIVAENSGEAMLIAYQNLLDCFELCVNQQHIFRQRLAENYFERDEGAVAAQILQAVLAMNELLSEKMTALVNLSLDLHG